MKNISKEAMIALTIGESFNSNNRINSNSMTDPILKVSNSGMYGEHRKSFHTVGSSTDRSKVKKSRKANKKRRSKKK